MKREVYYKVKLYDDKLQRWYKKIAVLFTNTVCNELSGQVKILTLLNS